VEMPVPLELLVLKREMDARDNPTRTAQRITRRAEAES
jgi:hypothetical protein